MPQRDVAAHGDQEREHQRKVQLQKIGGSKPEAIVQTSIIRNDAFQLHHRGSAPDGAGEKLFHLAVASGDRRARSDLERSRRAPCAARLPVGDYEV